MKHVHVEGHGTYLGLRGQRLVLKSGEQEEHEFSLNRVRTVTVHGTASSISSALLLACASRGIRLSILGMGGQNSAWVGGTQQHAVVAVRSAQFRAIDDRESSIRICRRIVQAKVRNQRAVLLYFGKYFRNTASESAALLQDEANMLARLAEQARAGSLPADEGWRETLMGVEGQAARRYWQALRQCDLLTTDFFHREGRGADDVANAGLNYGYAILASRVWNCLANAGLEIHAGIFHQDRPGKPSLVLDLMEEFRAWVVDRSVIKLRRQLNKKNELSPKLRRALAAEIGDVMCRKYPWRKRRLTLSSIMQRQAYRLAAAFSGEKEYRGYMFRW